MCWSVYFRFSEERVPRRATSKLLYSRDIGDDGCYMTCRVLAKGRMEESLEDTWEIKVLCKDSLNLLTLEICILCFDNVQSEYFILFSFWYFTLSILHYIFTLYLQKHFTFTFLLSSSNFKHHNYIYDWKSHTYIFQTSHKFPCALASPLTLTTCERGTMSTLSVMSGQTRSLTSLFGCIM